MVIRRRSHHRHVAKILGGRADHRGPADINVFDQFVESNARRGGGLLEGVEIHDYHIDGGNLVLRNGGAVRRIGAHMQNAAVHPRMQRLHPAIEHFGKAGERGNVFYLDAAFPQQLSGAAGGD